MIETLLDYNFKKVNCGYYHSALLDENGSLFICGNNEFGQIGNKSNQNQKVPISIFSVRESEDQT